MSADGTQALVTMHIYDYTTSTHRTHSTQVAMINTATGTQTAVTVTGYQRAQRS